MIEDGEMRVETDTQNLNVSINSVTNIATRPETIDKWIAQLRSAQTWLRRELVRKPIAKR